MPIPRHQITGDRKRRQVSGCERYYRIVDLTSANDTKLHLCFIEDEQVLAFEGDLLHDTSIRAMCSLSESVVRSHSLYSQVCYTDVSSSCVPDISLGNILASWKGKSRCQDITNEDVNELIGSLARCAQLYLDGKLDSDCAERMGSSTSCSQVSSECSDMNAMFTIMHYLIDVNFVKAIASWCGGKSGNCDDSLPVLQYSIAILQAKESASVFEVIYKDRLTSTVSNDGVTLVGFSFDGVAYKVFQERLLSDVIYPALSIIIVFIIMWIYTGTLFVTGLSVFAIMSSMGVAYFWYTIVFGVDFFPFINLTAIVILIGVGSDDVFVFMDTWKQIKRNNPNASIVERVQKTLRHAALSMFVTSFTTSAAFFANAISSIISIKCFGVYAGISVLVNYILMITWLPAVVVISEKYIDVLWEKITNGRLSSFVKIKHVWNLCLQKCSSVYTVGIPWLIFKVHLLLVILLVGLGIGMTVVVFHSPGLQLPTTNQFQLFLSSDILSTYDFKLVDRFAFESSLADEETMPIVFAFGPIPEDHGSQFEPSQEPVGPVKFQQTSMVISEAGQVWLLEFCSDIRNQTFYRQGYESCFILDMNIWLQQLKTPSNCADYKATVQRYARGYNVKDVEPLCCDVILPTNVTTFSTCLVHWSIAKRSYSTSWNGPLFQIDMATKEIQLIALFVQVTSNQVYTNSYTDMNSFWESVQKWLDSIGRSAPRELQGGWFTSPYYLRFYDLQQSLSIGSVLSMGVSIGVAFAVLFLTSLNVLISVYAIVSIAGTLVCTVGTLVLLGWQLNIMESVAMSIAVGLSVDFAVHYGVAYRLCSEPDRKKRTQYAITHMGPAITMAAVTTFVAGAMMMPSQILAYHQLGIFLMLIMLYSWIFANFFFLPICCLIGPQGMCCQIKIPRHIDCYLVEESEQESASGYSGGVEMADSTDMEEMTEPLIIEE